MLTYSWAVGWAAAKPFTGRGSAIKPEQSQAFSGSLAAAPSPQPGRQAAGAGWEPSQSLWPTQQLQLSETLWWVVIKWVPSCCLLPLANRSSGRVFGSLREKKCIVADLPFSHVL